MTSVRPRRTGPLRYAAPKDQESPACTRAASPDSSSIATPTIWMRPHASGVRRWDSPRSRPPAPGTRYTGHSHPPPDQPHLEVQRVAHPSHVHLDIEADDIEAEVRRLEKLGARRIGPVGTWYVMEAPTGQRFCVVRAQRADFDAKANTWNERR